jgi:predicted acyl esterase
VQLPALDVRIDELGLEHVLRADRLVLEPVRVVRGIADEAPIHYHTLHAETWQAASHWPPVESRERWFLQPSGELARSAPAKASRAAYQARFTTGTGRSTRYERLGAFAVAAYYADWDGREDGMLAFTSAPLATDVDHGPARPQKIEP